MSSTVLKSRVTLILQNENISYFKALLEDDTQGESIFVPIIVLESYQGRSHQAVRRNVQIQWNKGSTTASIGLQALRCVRKNEMNDCVFIYFMIFGCV